MATELDSFPFFHELNQATWADEGDGFNNVSSFPQDLQALDDHLFDFETDPLLSLPRSDSNFFMDHFNYDPIPPDGVEPTTMITEQCIEPDVCDTFLNDSAFGPITPDENINIMDENLYFSNTTTLWNPNSTSSAMSIPNDIGMLQPMIFGANNTTDVMTPTGANHADNEDDEEEEEEHEPKRGTLNCKNLVSERNRRKRLSQQLLTLRTLVPNITKMDKRSVLVDALAYLKSLHEETAKLQKELKEQKQQPSLSDLRESNQDNPAGTLRVPRSLPSPTISKPKAEITEIDTEKIEEKRFVVKITCKGVGSIGGDILRLFESLDFEITYTSLQQLKPQEMLVTVFIRVRKQGKMTEEKLKDCITSMALRSGIIFHNI